jgi:uncharacterized SAM-binding protein YcdF (DUF218 family)
LSAGLFSDAGCFAGFGVAVLWFAATPLVSSQIMRAAEGWQTRRALSSVPAAQAIVVLSAGRIQPPGETDVSEWGDPDRFFGGVELYKAGKAPLLIFTGGWAPWQPNAKPEGDILAEYAAGFGIPRDHILTTPKVTNTEEESHAIAQVLAKRLGANTTPRVLLVTSAYHMRRAHMLFLRSGLQVEPVPVDFQVSRGKTFTLMDLLPGGGPLSQSEAACENCTVWRTTGFSKETTRTKRRTDRRSPSRPNGYRQVRGRRAKVSWRPASEKLNTRCCSDPTHERRLLPARDQ